MNFSSKTKVESNYDYIYIYDGNNNQIGKYTGTALASKSITVNGNVAKIKLTSDSSSTYYGFSLDSIIEINSDLILPASGHKLSDWIVDIQPTIDNVGYKHIECTKCHEILFETQISNLICGDGNGDGLINAQDIIILKQALLTDSEYNEVLDCNGDGFVDIRDLVRMKKYLVDDTVPLGKQNNPLENSQPVLEVANLPENKLVS